MRAPSWTGILVNRTAKEESTLIQGGIAAESVAVDVPIVPSVWEESAAEETEDMEDIDLD